MGAILYENLIRTATASSIGTVSGNIDSLKDGRTSSSDKFAVGATRSFVIDNGSAKTINTLGIARHNLGSAGATVTVQGSSDNASYSTLFSVSPSNDKVIMEIKSSNYSYRYYRVQISGHSIEAFTTDISIGARLDLERDQKGGFVSPLYANNDEIIPNITRGQNLAGITVKPAPKKVRLKFPYYSSGFYSAWETIISSMKAYPVYLKWDSAGTKEAFYGWPDRRLPQPAFSKNVQNYGYLDTSVNLEGITE